MLPYLTYVGEHEVKVNGGEDATVREVPAIVTPPLRERVRHTLEANRRYPVGRDGKRAGGRRYLLSGLIRCGVCGSPCRANSVTNGDKRGQFSACNDARNGERPPRGPKGHARFLPARWLEEVVWADIRGFLENPNETLHRVRDELASADDTEELASRHADLTKRVAAKHKKRDRYIRLCAQGYIAEGELDGYLVDLRSHTDNLRLLLESVEADLAVRHEEPRVRITYRFDEPEGVACEQDSGLFEASRNSTEFFEAKVQVGR